MPKKKIAIIVLISVFIVLILPYALEVFIFRNNAYSVLSNGEWGSFLGSYTGGALGGVGTLLAVFITTKETRKIQRENSTQIENEKRRIEKKERKQFADEIAKDIATYTTYISKYFETCWFLGALYDKESRLDNELNAVENKIEAKYIALKSIVNDDGTEKCSSIRIDLEELKQKKAELKYKIERNSTEIERNKADRTIANERYFLLKIKLKNIVCGTDILKQLKVIYDNSACVRRDYSGFMDVSNFMEKEIDELLDMTTQFVDRYVNQKVTSE